MPTQLKPGAMGSPLDGTTPAEFANSMAAAMEAELNKLLQADGLPQLTVNDNSRETRDRRRLFVAIARGVVRHLDEQHEAIKVQRTDSTHASPTFAIYGKDW
jgi:hypothetical protein